MRAADPGGMQTVAHVADVTKRGATDISSRTSRRAPLDRIGNSVWGLVLWMAVLGFAFQGARGIWEPDEGRYVAIALNMLTTGDYLVPRLDREHPHYAKPPLTYWAIAASISTFGRTEWAVRLPSAAAFFLTGLVVTMLGAAIELRRPMLAATVWSTTLLPFLAASIATTDMLLTLFESLAVLGYLQWRRRASQRGVWLMWLSFGVAFMTKGPPALLPLLAIVVFETSCGRDRRVRGLFQSPPMLAFMIIACWWFFYLLARDPSLWRYFLVNETLDRLVTAVHQRNPGWKGLVDAYAPVLFGGTLPFAPVLIWSVLRGRRHSQVADARRGVPRRFLYLWMSLPFAIFAVAQSRLPLYLLPITIPFALTTALSLERAGISVRLIRNIAMLCAVALLGLRLVSAHWATERDTRALAQELSALAHLDNYNEVIFVDGHRPAYGLEFYTGKQIEAAHTGETLRAIDASEPLCVKLMRSDAQLLLVPEAGADWYIREAQRCNGTQLLSVGRVRQYALLGKAAIYSRAG